MTDKKRLTAKEVAEQLSREIERLKNLSRADALWKASGLDIAHELIVDNLIPRWQDEPDGDGWYWVDGYDGPRYVKLNSGTWMNGDDHCMQYGYKLNNRRVCPIGERPEGGE